MTPQYYLVGPDETILGRVRDDDQYPYEYLDPDTGEWVAHPLVCDLVTLGYSWELPPPLPWGFPGWSREIPASEAETFMERLKS